jgi:type IV fimbrial biogenesis protein FimT
MKLTSAGLTALDLLISMVIVAVLIVSGVPALRDHMLEQNLRAASAGLQSHLLYARSEAVQRRISSVVCPGTETTGCSSVPEWQQGWIVFSDTNGDRKFQATEPLLRVGPPPESVQITSSKSRRKLRFLPNGSAPGSNATIRICTPADNTKGRQIKISNTGRITGLKPVEGEVTGC